MNHAFITATILVCSVVTNVSGAKYYASPTGTGNGTSYDAPMSLSSGLSKLASGDSLFLLGGQYDLTSTITIQKAGTSESSRTFVGAYPGEKPILDFRNQKHSSNGVSLKNNYIHVKGLTIRYAGYKGIQNTGSYNLMENLDVYGNCDTGIQQKGGNNNTILNCDSHDNFDYITVSGTYCDYGGNADGFADKQYTNSPGNTYIGCRSWNNSDDGWDFFERVGGTTTFKNCICFNNGPKYYDMSHYARLTTDAYWFDKFKKDTVVVNSSGSKFTCSITKYYNNGNGNGFKLGGNNTKHDVTLYNCLSIGNYAKGFDQNSNAGAIQIYNGTSYLNGSNYGFYNDNGYSLVIKNCVSLPSSTSNTFKCSKLTTSNNTWLSGYSCTASDFLSIDTTLVLTPRNADGSLATTDLLRLVKGSTLIDKGLIIDGVDYYGAAPDLGCFESNYQATGINDVESSSDAISGNINIYDTAGRLVGTAQNGKIDTSVISHGIYIVRSAVTNKTISKILVR